MLNTLFDNRISGDTKSISDLAPNLLKEFDSDFSKWWDEEKASYGFSEIEQKVYLAFIEMQKGSIESLSLHTSLSQGEVADALDILLGTGVILQLDDENYKIDSKLFEKWVIRETS